MSAPAASAEPMWEVVGGRDQGGILVRTGAALSSPAEQQRLSTGARLVQLSLLGERLQFRRLDGTGPESGWVTTRVQGRDLVVRAGAEALPAAGAGPRVQYFDLLRGPVDQPGATVGQEEETDAGELRDILLEYSVTEFRIERILRTELGRSKVFVSTRDASGKERHLFVGRVVEGGPSLEAVEASITAFLEIGRHCRSDFVSVADFLQTRSGGHLYRRHLVSPARGPSDWGRSTEDRFMLAAAIGELHRASAKVFARGLPKQVERDMVEDEVGLGVLGWGLTVDYASSGLEAHEVGRIKFIISALQGLDRADRIRELPKLVVHTDLQFKNLCRAAPGSRLPVLVDAKLGHRASRIWDLYFILCGDDLCSLLPRNEQATDDFVRAIRRYESVSEMPFSEEESFLLMNTIMIKAIFNSCFFGSFEAHLPGSQRKCKAAYDTMEWIIARKDHFRSIFF